ncbi:hypothetical protein BS78_02G377400 [Paspalum vaginatum]|nr:hypothetical protein BS78_02G377400 [Paspalum vaginatum]
MACGVLRWLCARRRWRRPRAARLVLWGGEARAAEPGTAAGEVMMEHAGRVVCRADAFRVGRPAPVLAVDDALEAGRTYLVVPVDRVPCGGQDGVVTAASLAALSHGAGRSPFRYGKDEGGRTVVSVAEEFVVRAVAGGGGGRDGAGCGALCSTPELRKHYDQLVGTARGRPWSPGLDTIKERSRGRRLADVVVVSPGRLSPVRLLGMMDKRGSSGS